MEAEGPRMRDPPVMGNSEYFSQENGEQLPAQANKLSFFWLQAVEGLRRLGRGQLFRTYQHANSNSGNP